MKKLLAIGRFARLSRLSVKALRHYDSVGLLKPSSVDPATGYRLYTVEQAADAERIQLLRAVDLPLSEVAEVLTSPPAVQQGILEAHRVRLAESARRLEERLAATDRLLTRWSHGTGAEVSVKTVPPLLVISRRASLSAEAVGAFVGPAVIGLAQALFAAGGQVSGPAMTVYHESPLEDAVDLEVALPVERGAPLPEGEPSRELSEERVACVQHRGHYLELPHSYRRLLQWLQGSGLTPSGPWRELYLVSPSTTQVAAEWVTEVQLPIEDD
jgi:DNA-binding transcriptional MerR regulator